MSAETRILLEVTDPVTGDYSAKRIGPDGYVVVGGENRRVESETTYSDGRVALILSAPGKRQALGRGGDTRQEQGAADEAH